MTMGKEQERLFQIAAEFDLEGTVHTITPYGSGHINDTYLVVMQEKDGGSGTKRYILQRMNTAVFTKPLELMENISGVTRHLKKKIRSEGGDPKRKTLSLIKTKQGKNCFVAEDRGYYRMYDFIEGAVSYDAVKRPEDFYESAVAFGRFQYLLSDYPAETLHETIPDFHNTVKRYQDLEAAIAADVAGRKTCVEPEIAFVRERKAELGELLDLQRAGKLPLRVTHNDTKLNNIMMDEKTGRGICVIDLDTVMPGLSLYDFGDSIRYGANTGAEDEVDLTRVSLDLSLYRLYKKGYLEGSRGSLSALEQKMLPVGAKLMTLECGIRFLADYLNGDTYFKIHRKQQNLDRCRSQFALVADMEKKWDAMCRED